MKKFCGFVCSSDIGDTRVTPSVRSGGEFLGTNFKTKPFEIQVIMIKIELEEKTEHELLMVICVQTSTSLAGLVVLIIMSQVQLSCLSVQLTLQIRTTSRCYFLDFNVTSISFSSFHRCCHRMHSRSNLMDSLKRTMHCDSGMVL